MIQFPSSNTYTASTSTSSSNSSLRNTSTDDAAKTASAEKTSTPEKTSGLTLGERQDAATTASNILGFVARGIDALRSSGADEERLNQRLEAARAGIEKGYQQASDQLEALGLMDDSLEADIQNSRSQVDMALTDLGSLKDFTALSSSQATSIERSSSRSELLSFEVLTRDGDRVTVSFSNDQSLSENLSNGRYAFSAFEDKQFDFSVNGQLDDAELGALNDLLKQVNSLSSQFFDGDLGAALQQAMDIGYDATELASFSLNLYQSTLQTTEVQTSVSQRQGYPITQAQLPTPELESLKAPLMNYVDSFLSALEKTSPFADGLKLLDDMVESLMTQPMDEENTKALTAFTEFNSSLAELGR